MHTRRDLARMAAVVLPSARMFAGAGSKPNSNFGGVHVGINAPYSYGNTYLGGEETLARTVQLGLSYVELRTQPIEQLLGSPEPPPPPNGSRGRGAPTPAQIAERKAAADALSKWRLSRTVDQFKSVRKKYNSAGVDIEIVKADWIQNATDDLVDYCFALAKAVGARAISCEIPLSKTKWLGAFADRHKMLVAYHGHIDVNNPEAFARPASWETAMSYARYNGINLDIGHFVAANSESPIPFLTKHHARISHVHIKDRKMNNGPNVPFGQGDTPVREVLRLIQRNRWKIQATIEFEYPIPQGSDRTSEIARCVAFCKQALA